MNVTICVNSKKNEKGDFLMFCNIRWNYRLKNNKQRVWNKNVQGGIFQQFNKRWEGGDVHLFGVQEHIVFSSSNLFSFLNLFKENSSSETITLYFHLFRTASIAILTSTILDQTYEANCRFRTNWHCFHVCIGEIDKTCLND